MTNNSADTHVFCSRVAETTNKYFSLLWNTAYPLQNATLEMKMKSTKVTVIVAIQTNKVLMHQLHSRTAEIRKQTCSSCCGTFGARYEKTSTIRMVAMSLLLGSVVAHQQTIIVKITFRGHIAQTQTKNWFLLALHLSPTTNQQHFTIKS